MKKNFRNIFTSLVLSLLSVPVYAASPLAKKLSFESDNKNFSATLGGWLQFDSAFYKDDVTPVDDGSKVRRLRFEIKGMLLKDWQYIFSYEGMADNSKIFGTFLAYNGFEKWRLSVGNLKQPFSQEELMAPKHISFIERSLIHSFAPSFTLGVTAETWGRNWAATFGTFGDNLSDRDKNNDGSHAVAARISFLPIETEQSFFHLAGASVYQDIGSDQTISFSARPESGYTNTRLLATGALRKIDSKRLYGLEAAYVDGPWSLQSEYMHVKLDRKNSADVDFSGWYVQATWFVTGEQRTYSRKSGIFGNIKPKSKYGAVELGARYSSLDLDDHNVRGGKGNNMTLGVNWHINEYVKIMANYVKSRANPTKDRINEKIEFFETRLQLWF